MFKEPSVIPQTDPDVEKEKLSPVEMQIQIKQELDQAVSEYTNKDSSTLKAEDYFSTLNKIETLKNMAEKFNNDTLSAYFEEMLTKIKSHKDLSTESKFKNMGPLKTMPKRTNKPGIGTHQ